MNRTEHYLILLLLQWRQNSTYHFRYTAISLFVRGERLFFFSFSIPFGIINPLLDGWSKETFGWNLIYDLQIRLKCHGKTKPVSVIDLLLFNRSTPTPKRKEVCILVTHKKRKAKGLCEVMTRRPCMRKRNHLFKTSNENIPSSSSMTSLQDESFLKLVSLAMWKDAGYAKFATIRVNHPFATP